MAWDFSLINAVKKYLPEGAVILKPQNYFETLQTLDVDGDGIPEIAVAYKYNGKAAVMILKPDHEGFKILADIQGNGYDINILKTTDFLGHIDLVAGWQIGAIWSTMDFYNIGKNGPVNEVSGIEYSMAEFFKQPSAPGATYLAVWTHDTGEAYNVEIYKWSENQLAIAPEAYRFYYPKVVRYYQAKVAKLPNAAFLWCQYALALYRSGEYMEALSAIDTAISLHAEYPDFSKLMELKKQIKESITGLRSINLYPAAVNEVGGQKWGYIDKNGNFAIKPIYNFSFDFQPNGFAVVSLSGKYGIINGSGEYIVKPVYEFINNFYEGVAVAEQSNMYLLIDKTGRVLFNAKNYIGSMNNGRAVFSRMNDRYGYIDNSGRVVISERFIYANNFYNETAVVKLGENRYSLIDLNGKVLHEFPYGFVGDLREGLMAYSETENGKFGYIDIQGNIVIRPIFSSANDFVNGFAVVNKSDNLSEFKYGAIDKNGNFVIQAKYNDLVYIGDNLFSAGIPLDKKAPYKGSVYGIIDISGKQVTPFKYYNVQPVQNGYISVSDDKQTYFINEKGEKVQGLPIVQGSGTLTFTGALIKADVDNRISYYGRNGSLVWEPNKIIRLNPQYYIRELKYNPDRNYLVYYPEIEGMSDKSAQKNVNEKLKVLSQVKDIGNKPLDYNYQGEFEVEYYKKNLVIIQFEGYNYSFGAAHGMPTKIYTHIDLVTGSFYNLSDLFKPGSDYVKVLSEIIRKQIIAQGSDSYIWLDSYKGISPEQPFYLDSENLYIYFNPYDIAPYAAGFPTFKIRFVEILNIINTNGEFWRAFH